jgi:predicted  nucleic acid-binding Zn-ribbon protein
LGNNLKLLAELQIIDLKLDSRNSEKEEFLKELAVLDEKLEAARGGISVKQAEMDELELGKKELEGNLDAETDNIARSEVRLKDIKTQKEYQAVSKEIAAAKKIKAELEEQLLQKIARIDELKAEIAAMEVALKSLEENIDSRKLEAQQKIDAIEAGINADIAGRESMLGEIQPSLLKRYAMLRAKRQGLAVVEARNGSCLGCNMNLPPQVYNDLYKTENLVTCPHCQRMLFLRQDEELG